MALKTGLVLSGGGARGAYQVGVLKGLCSILKEKKVNNPFQILSGTSAGAINTAKLACAHQDFYNAVIDLEKLWTQIRSEQVFKTEILSFNKFSLGSLLSAPKKFNSILDTTPLKKLIEDHCLFPHIQSNLEKGLFETIIITTNNYNKNKAVSFIQSASKTNSNLSLWKESRRSAEFAQLSSSHIMASSAIPMLFPPIYLNGEPHGDGCVRNSTPCSPAIKMGAEKIFVIGVRSQNTEESIHQLNTQNKPIAEASMIRILNTLLNAVLLDSVEQDVQRIQRINELYDEAQKNHNDFKSQKLKKIPALCVSPSQDIGEIARQKAHHIPRILRMTISAFGDLNEASEILSYLLFDSAFCKTLIDMGYEDSRSQKQEIINFFEL